MKRKAIVLAVIGGLLMTGTATGSETKGWGPEPKLKRKTAKAIFKKTAAQGKRLKPYTVQTVRCDRSARTRMRCRGRWIAQIQDYNYRLKGAGWVNKSGRYFRSKIVFRIRVTTPNDSYVTPPETEWGFFSVRPVWD